jgi:hypothetical protein
MIQREALKEARALPSVMESTDVSAMWNTCFQTQKKQERLECSADALEKSKSIMNLYYINADKQAVLDYWIVGKDAYLADRVNGIPADVYVETASAMYLANFYEELIRESNAQLYAYNKAMRFSNSIKEGMSSLTQTSNAIRLHQLETQRRR